jgi:hypothetical protein
MPPLIRFISGFLLSILLHGLSDAADAQAWEYGLSDDYVVARITLSPEPEIFRFQISCVQSDLVAGVRVSEYAGSELMGVYLKFFDQDWRFEVLMSDYVNSDGVFISTKLKGEPRRELVRELSSRDYVMVRIEYAASIDDFLLNGTRSFEFRLPLDGSSSAIGQLDAYCK